MKLKDHFLLGAPFIEHHQFYYKELVISEQDFVGFPHPIHFKSNPKDEFCCFKIDDNRKPYTSYFIGTDWLSESENKAIYVQPKLNKDKTEQVDYIQMLFSLLRNPETLNYVDDIYEIKWDATPIEINQQQDLLTPLIVVQFLQVIQRLVRRGLKKSYYKVESNLYGKVKGKILVASTIKHNLVKNKTLNTWCAYDEFGFNGLENRLLKKALVFVQRYLSSHNNLNMTAGLNNLFNYINPAFSSISEEVSLHEVKHIKKNVFYKEYEEGIRLAKLILKKFGYNITNTEQEGTINTPPFWIDMSKLFELYVYGKLLNTYSNIKFQFNANYGQPDFLLQNEKIIVDAKYKIYYKGELSGNSRIHEIAKDIRQLSGYARDNAVLNYFGYTSEEQKLNVVIPCLIIYPDTEASKELANNPVVDIKEFVGFKKQPIALPIIN